MFNNILVQFHCRLPLNSKLFDYFLTSISVSLFDFIFNFLMRGRGRNELIEKGSVAIGADEEKSFHYGRYQLLSL